MAKTPVAPTQQKLPQPRVAGPTVPATIRATVPAPARAVAVKAVKVSVAETPATTETPETKEKRVRKPLLERITRTATSAMPKLAKLNKAMVKWKAKKPTEDQVNALANLTDGAGVLVKVLGEVLADLAFLAKTECKLTGGGGAGRKAKQFVAGMCVEIKKKFYNEADFGSNGDLSVVEVGTAMLTLAHGMNSKAPQIKVPKSYVDEVEMEGEEDEANDADLAGDDTDIADSAGDDTDIQVLDEENA